MEEHDQAGGITRRQLLAFALAGTAAGIIPGFAFAAEEGQRGGFLNVSMTTDPPNFDLLSNTTSRVLDSIGPCYNGLVQFDPLDPNSIIGDLAESWETSEDGLEVTFHLHDGVRFHDGVPMTSQDVKYTFDVTRAPPEGYVSSRKSVLSAVADIEARDDQTVVFKLSRPSPGLIASLCTNWFSVLPKHVLEKGPMKDVVVGTGAFKFSGYSHGNVVNLVRNEDYFRPDRPYLDGINIYIIPNASTAWAYFTSGQLNATEVERSIRDSIPQAVKDSSNLQKVAGLNAIGVHFNHEVKPWDDVRVRKAAALALNRTAALNVQFSGHAVLGGMAPPSGKWTMPDERLHSIPGFKPSPEPKAVEDAKALLAEAGYPDGLDAKLVVRNDDYFTSWGVFLKDQFERIGIRIQLEPQEAATYAESQKSRAFDLHGGNLSIAIDDPDAIFGNQVPCGASGNFSQICDTTIDDMFVAVSQELDPVERKRLSNDLEFKLLSEYHVLPVAFTIRTEASHNSVHNLLPHPQSNNNRRYVDTWIG